MNTISSSDVQLLLKDPSAENRERTVIKLAQAFQDPSLESGTSGMVEEVLRILAHDAAVRVRKAVAVQLQNDPNMPSDIALSLARDVADVAVPVLRFSRALSDDDLAELAASEGQEKLSAMASRLHVGPVLSDALIVHGDEDTVATLLANDGSAPTEYGLIHALDRFSDSDKVQAPMAHRAVLPPAVMVKMITLVSDHVLKELSERPDLPSDLAADIIEQAQERAFISLAAEGVDPGELAARLYEAGHLSPVLAVRALLSGDFRFFEEAISRLAGMDLGTACSLIYDTGALGVRELCRRANIPASMHEVVCAAVAAGGDLGFAEAPADRLGFQARMIERILTHFDSLGEHIDPKEVEGLIDKLRLSAA